MQLLQTGWGASERGGGRVSGGWGECGRPIRGAYALGSTCAAHVILPYTSFLPCPVIIRVGMGHARVHCVRVLIRVLILTCVQTLDDGLCLPEVPLAQPAHQMLVQGVLGKGHLGGHEDTRTRGHE